MNTPIYFVRPGDTLSSIAQRELGRASAWPALFKANYRAITAEQCRRHISPQKPEDFIFPGQRLELPRLARQG